MSRRTLDFVISGAAVGLAVLILVLGFVLADQGAFARSYVKDQLGEQKITFAEADKLTPEETSWKPGSSCLTANAGKLMETGKQAECYANYFIAMHLDRSATAAGLQGETYATLGPIRTQLAADVAAAKAKNDSTAADAAQKKLDSATALRASTQTGETLRGLLLTSYGFSIFGEKAALAGIVCFVIAGLLFIVGIAGFVHAFRTPATEMVGVPAGYIPLAAPKPL